MRLLMVIYGRSRLIGIAPTGIDPIEFCRLLCECLKKDEQTGRKGQRSHDGNFEGLFCM